MIISAVVGLALGFWWKQLVIVSVLLVMVMAAVTVGSGGELGVNDPVLLLQHLTMRTGFWIESNLELFSVGLVAFIVGALFSK